MKYQLGLGTGMGIARSTAEQIPMIKAAGFDAVFTGWAPDAPIETFSRLVKENGLIYQSIHAPFKSVHEIWKGSETGQEYVKLLLSCLSDCAKNKVPLMVIHPFIGFKDHTPTDIGLELYGRIVKAAEECGVYLGFENVEGAEYLAAIMKAFASSPAVGFCWDTGHEQCYNFGIDQMELYGDRLRGTHFNDNLGGGNTPETITWLDDLHLLPFDGKNDWKGIMDRIRASGFEGILTFELTTTSKPNRHENDAYAAMRPEEYLKEAYNRAVRVAEL